MNSQSKNILILIKYWPPYAGPGARRWTFFSKYLARHRFKVHVCILSETNLNLELYADQHLDDMETPTTKTWSAPNPFEVTIDDGYLQRPYFSAKESRKKPKLLDRIKHFLPFTKEVSINPQTVPAVFLNYINEHRIDWMVSVDENQATHCLAEALKSELPGLHWLADIPASWESVESKLTEKSVTYIAENNPDTISFMNHADQLTSPNAWVCKRLASALKPECLCIPNGFSAGAYQDPEISGDDGEIKILSPGHDEDLIIPTNFWQCLNKVASDLETEGFKITVGFMQPPSKTSLETISSIYPLKWAIDASTGDNIETGLMSYEQAHVILIAARHPLSVPARLYEGLASRRKLILFAEHGNDAERILKGSNKYLFWNVNEADVPGHETLGDYLKMNTEAEFQDDSHLRHLEWQNLTKDLVKLLA